MCVPYLTWPKVPFPSGLPIIQKIKQLAYNQQPWRLQKAYPLEDYLLISRPDSSRRWGKDWVGNAGDDPFAIQDSETVT